VVAQGKKSISTVEFCKIVDTIYPAESHIPGILYTDKKPFGFLIFRLAGRFIRKKNSIYWELNR
jgi:hypothetical protein